MAKIGKKPLCLTDIEIEKIKRMYKDGISKRQIAKVMKVSEGTIRNRLK